MNTKLLKQKILDLAIRGKLTDQRKSDGTAADLLKEICDRTQEKTSLRAKRGNPSPQTIIPLDKSEAPFEIPANWEWVRIGDIFNLQAGKNIAAGLISSTCEDGYYPCFGGNGLRGFVSCFNREGDYPLIGRQGALCGNINRATGKFYATEHAVVVETNSMMNVSLACFFLTQLNLNQYASSTAQPGLSVAKINEVPIPLPPLAEQQRIVAKIEEAFAEIDAIEKNKELLKTHIKQTRQKILDLAIHGKLVPQNKSDEPASVLLERITRDNPHYEKIEDEPFEIPQNWAWCRLGNICDKLIDGDHNPPKGLDYATEHMMLSSRNINDNDIVDLENVRYLSKEMFEEENQRTKLEEGDILFTSVGSLGRSCIFSGDGKYCFQRSVSLIHTNIYNKYLKYFFDSNYYQKYIVENATGTAQMGFYLEQMRKSFIAIPPLAEQFRIVAKIEELFAELDLVLQNV